MLMLHNEQIDRIEAKLDRLLELLDKPKREVKRSVSDYSPEFEEIWQIYPKRTGSNPKRSAYIAYQARIKAGETLSVLRDGVVAYRAFCDAKGDTGSSYVMQAVRFFGPNKEYLQDWIAPAQKARKPASEAEWLELGKKFGLDPRVGEPWRDFMDRVWSRV